MNTRKNDKEIDVPTEVYAFVEKGNKYEAVKTKIGTQKVSEKKIAVCDICNREIGHYSQIKNVVEPETMTKAIEKGYRPTELLSQYYFFGKYYMEELYKGWKEMAIGSETPWALCDKCKAEMEKILEE